MKNISKISTVALRFLAASTIALGLVPATYAHDGTECTSYFQKDGVQKMPPSFKELNLTQDQQEKVRAISAAHQEVMHQNIQRLHDNKDAEVALIESPSFDEAKAQRLVDAESKIMAENHLATLRFRHEIYQILTPEQRTKLEASRNQRHEARHRGKSN